MIRNLVGVAALFLAFFELLFPLELLLTDVLPPVFRFRFDFIKGV
ncbi:hypothetical protein N9D38_06370 [Rubripirellula sp.]|nr:hypothetical protein [Rubripirellula sp.]